MLSTWAAQGLTLQQSPYQGLSISAPGPGSGPVLNEWVSEPPSAERALSGRALLADWHEELAEKRERWAQL